MSATSTERPSSSKLESKEQKSTLSRGNMTQAQKSNQAASSTVITVAAGQRLMSIPEQLFGDETASNVRTPERRQPAVQEPPPVDPGMGPPQQRYTSMGYAQPASSPMGGFAHSLTWGTRGPPPGPVPQLDMESASNTVTSLPCFCVKEKGRNQMGTPTNQSNTQYASSLLSNLFNSKG
ncbi:hypothetical protein F5051DRAFT_446778 [Lentinula edodes]|nr:hypothetical protein F5051DRAFT_446778 [Lentinula edodes]